MKNQLISGIIKAVIRKKLEDLVLNTMSHPEDVPEDIINGANIAKELGYSEISVGFNEIFNEVGKIQIERTIQKKREKRERELKEKQFQDYLITHPKKLEDIEKGLKILKSEKDIRSGRLDIAALDEKENKAGIELKARDYDSIDTHVKIEKYLHEDDTKKARVFFVAPEIKPDLFFSLRELQEEGRVRFFEYNFDFENQEYCTFKEVKADDFEEPKNIPWGRIKRKKTDNGLIRVTAAVGKPDIKTKRKPLEEEIKEAKEVKKEEKFYDEEWESYPAYYKALLRSRPKLKDKKKYFQPIEIEREQLRGLEELVISPELERIMADYENRKEWFIDPTTWSNEFKNARYKLLKKPFSNNPKKTEALFRKFATRDISYWRETEKQVVEIVNGMSGAFGKTDEEYSECINNLKQKQIRLSNLIEKITSNSDMIDLKLFLMNSMENISKSEESKIIGDYIKDVLFRFSYPVEQITNEFTKLKIARAEELSKLDRNLAIVYSYFGFETNIILREGRIPPNFKWEISAQNLIEFVKADNELYKSILSHFKAKEEIKYGVPIEEWETYPLYYKVLLKTSPKLKDKEKYLSPIEISKGEKQNLEELIEPNEFNKSMKELENHIHWYMPPEEAEALSQSSKIGLPEVRGSLEVSKKIFNGGFEKGKEYHNKIERIGSLMLNLALPEYALVDGEERGLEERLKFLNEARIEFDMLIKNGKYQDELLQKFRDLLKKGIKNAENSERGEKTKKYFKNLLYLDSFYNASALNEFFKLKATRTEAIRKIDGELAMSYLTFSPYIQDELIEILHSKEKIKGEKKFKGGAIRFDEKREKYVLKFEVYASYDFIKEDNELYESLISIFKVKEEPSKLEEIAQKTPETQNALVQTTYETHPQQIAHKTEHLKTKTHYGYPVSSVIPNRVYESLGKKKQVIVNEFVNVILNNPKYNRDIRKKYASLARESKWYNKSMDENQMRDFFGNLAINIEEECYKSKGK